MKNKKFLKSIMGALLIMVALVTMSMSDYQSWSMFKSAVSIMKNSRPNDSLMLELGKAADTNKQGVRLGPITQDTGRAHKVKGSIVWNRANSCYYFYNGTKWTSPTLALITGVATAGKATTTDTLGAGSFTTNGGTDRWQFLGYETGSGARKYLKVIHNGTTYWTEVFTALP